MNTRLDCRFQVNFKGNTNEKSIITGACYRFTVLTSQLIRIEYNQEGIFENRPTQSIVSRAFDVPAYRMIEDEKRLEIITEHMHLYYKKGIMTSNSLYIDVKGQFSAHGSRWYYGTEAPNLGGTARTLDDAKGEIPLEAGVIAKNGFSVIDDSQSLVITEDGWVEPRASKSIDLYFFGYGREYFKCIHDFFKLTGSTPLLPRYALGNWWSRYWPYNETEYKALMTRFKKEDVPFSVSVIDMDWHKVNIEPKYGSGWTGYSWNRELFPNPRGFMEWLHEANYKVTLNLHPADGVRAHEDRYIEMAKALGVDYSNEDPIPFDITNANFLDAYFKCLHHPLEEEGVDFWWIDWQQGSTTALEGLDPLWMLNHYHFYDNERQGKRGLIFSRYAGVGSHRYPVGFSGDTHITWDAYKFQPYFTATASNIGYCWWSHDIGGHMLGERDDELSARWVQFGTFSPILRLHSSCSPFTSKEPWRYKEEIQKTVKEHLRLRHNLIPYTYTMNWKLHKELRPFITPMYYHYPMEEVAYEVGGQYFFGTELMICPITEKTNAQTKMASVMAWLPKGRWIDFYDGTIYEGDRKKRMFRGIDKQVVLAKEGAIIPMTRHQEGDNRIDNPEKLDIMIFPGKDNEFSLYEDDGETKSADYVLTNIKSQWGAKSKIIIHKAQGNTKLIPQKRHIRILLRGVCPLENLKSTSEGITKDYTLTYDERTKTALIEIKDYDVKETLEIDFVSEVALANKEDRLGKIFEILDYAQIPYEIKDRIYYKVKDSTNIMQLISELRCMSLEDDLLDALLEKLI